MTQDPYKNVRNKKIKSIIDKEYKELKGATVLVSKDGRVAITTRGGSVYWLENEAMAWEFRNCY